MLGFSGYQPKSDIEPMLDWPTVNDPKRTTGRYFHMLVTVVKKKLIAPGRRTVGEFVLAVLKQPLTRLG